MTIIAETIEWNQFYALDSINNIDCLSGLRNLDSDIVDVIVTSPPYWGQRAGSGLGGEEDPREYVENLSQILSEAMRVLKPEGVLWLNLGDSFNTPINWRLEDRVHSTLGADGNGLDPENSAYTKERGNRKAFVSREDLWLSYGNLLGLPMRIVFNLCDRGFLFRGEIIWAKSKAMPEGRCRRPHRKHESIYILAKNEKHNFRVKPPVPSIWSVDAERNTTIHTSTFPVDLPRRCISASGLNSGVLLDPFMGSGTSAIAAQQAGLNYVGFEINPEYVIIAQKRILDVNQRLF